VEIIQAMTRPKTKSELIQLSRANYDKLMNFIHELPEEELNACFPSNMMNRNIRDILAHLHHWHLMMHEWYKVGMNGTKPDMPAKGFTWKTTPELNRWIWEKYNDRPLEEIMKKLDSSFQSLQEIIIKHTNKELFEKKRYKWTGTTSLGSYLVSATSSHYDWGLKLIKRAIKQRS